MINMIIVISAISICLIIAFVLLWPKKPELEPKSEKYYWTVIKSKNYYFSSSEEFTINLYKNNEIIDTRKIEIDNLSIQELDEKIADIKRRVLELHNLVNKHTSETISEANGSYCD